ncbi:MAG: DUF1304 domain-containing protein [Corynebacterium sp.]|nr:DUF1304 domain-containing protein [Corynebacterium sp.]
MSVLMTIFAALAALLHFYIFYMESFAWDKPATRKVFGELSKEELEHTKFMAFNQGLYNMMLGVVTFVGLFTGSAALVAAGTGSMFFAALMLGLTSKAHRSAAVKQGFLPLLALIFLILA